jgi:nucleoside-diphosphate kinase
MQRSLILVKPDAFRRNIVHKVLGRIEDKGFQIVNMQYWSKVPRSMMEKHYEQDREKSYFSANIDFMLSGPIISVIYIGENVISSIRRLQGNRDTPGTIRGDFVTDFRENLIHASDSVESAEKEIEIWFPETK